MPNTRDERAVRITQQFRSRNAMVYDLRSPEGRLTLRISGGSDDREQPTEWCVEAATGSSPDSVVVVERAATRAEALRAVGIAWDKKRIAGNLPPFDWESVASAMAAVRAL